VDLVVEMIIMLITVVAAFVLGVMFLLWYASEELRGDGRHAKRREEAADDGERSDSGAHAA
jgi:hypothetical protein